jgi:poly(hydroxyalkanoate) granule-associated protein
MATRKTASKTTRKTATSGKPSPAPLAKAVRDSAQEIWLAGLGAFAKTQDEGSKVFDAFVTEGKTLQSKVREAADTVTGRFSDARVSELTDKMVGGWTRFGKLVEEGAADAMGRAGVATKAEIATLARRVGKIADDVEQLVSGGVKKAAPRRRPAAKV